MYIYFNSFLVGDGAKQWAQQNGLPLIDSQEMKTGFIFLFSSQNQFNLIYSFLENSTYMFDKYKRKLDENPSESTKKTKTVFN